MQVRLHLTPAEIGEITDFWRAAQHHPNSDLEYFDLVCRSRPEVESPLAISVWDQGRCQCLVVGRVERSAVRPSFAYARLPAVQATAWTFVYAGVIGTLTSQGAAAVVAAVDTALRERRVDLASFNLITEGGPLHEAIRAQWPWIDGQAAWVMHRALEMQRDPDFLMKGMRSKHRYWIRRKEKELLAAFPAGVRWHWHAKAFDLPNLIDQIEMVARVTYQRGLGAGFVDNPETRLRMQLLAARGQLRVLVVEILGQPKAFWLGEVYAGTFHSSSTGYCPSLGDFEVGTLMFLRMVSELARENIDRIDFGLGDAHYKERFGDQAWREATFRVFARSGKGRLLSTYFRCVEGLGLLARKVVERAGAVDRIKRRWRQRKRQQLGDGGPSAGDASS